MKKIPLTQGYFALVDDEDFESLNRVKWYAQKVQYGGYRATRTCYCPLVKQKCQLYMHRQITNCPHRLQVDHVDHNTLNNQKSNLRICTNTQNQGNSKPCISTSKYKGITWYKRDKKWEAQIKINYKTIHLGRFNSEIEAAKVYDIAAKKHFGEFAYLNFNERL